MTISKRLRAVCFGVLAAARLLASGDPAADARDHERAGKIQLHGPAARTFLFFTPEGERSWAGEDWNPRPVCSVSGKDEEGMVFRNGTHESLWIVSRLDPAARAIEYVIVSPDVFTLLRIDVAAAGENESVAAVAYRWIARTPAGGEMAQRHDLHFTPMLESWQSSMNAVLAGRPATPHP